MMRFIFNAMVLLLIAGMVVGGVWFVREQRADEERLLSTLGNVQELQRVVAVQAGLKQVEVNGRGWPMTIDPEWFKANLPRNLVVSQDRPWLEVAPPEHADYLHPTVRMTISDDVAGFWYNPGNGIIRARTPVTVSDRLATEMYNSINATTLKSIFEDTTPAHTLSDEADALVQTDESDEAESASDPKPHPNR
ncbi:MAG: hypothetical protein ACYTF7_10230 [Planctomycetota bacterium]|jgi:hypothetical protein